MRPSATADGLAAANWPASCFPGRCHDRFWSGLSDARASRRGRRSGGFRADQVGLRFSVGLRRSRLLAGHRPAILSQSMIGITKLNLADHRQSGFQVHGLRRIELETRAALGGSIRSVKQRNTGEKQPASSEIVNVDDGRQIVRASKFDPEARRQGPLHRRQLLGFRPETDVRYRSTGHRRTAQ